MGDRRTEVNHPASGITTSTYDALGNVLTKQTANLAKEGKSITYDYDYHRLTGIEVNHPASGITTSTYDALGNVLTKQTANLAKEGKSITYDYDYHRLTGINYPDHPENNVK